MKRSLAAVAVVLSLVLVPEAHANGDYCEGFQDGYAEGWCYEEFGCIKPIPPICPIPRIGEQGYQDGYNRGFQTGTRAKARQRR